MFQRKEALIYVGAFFYGNESIKTRLNQTYICFMPNLKGTRLNKFISQSGYCSRRQADVYIESGQVKLNGKRRG